jgi:hypothetical protein
LLLAAAQIGPGDDVVVDAGDDFLDDSVFLASRWAGLGHQPGGTDECGKQKDSKSLHQIPDQAGLQTRSLTRDQIRFRCRYSTASGAVLLA